jgi:hypothetical protein
LPLAERRGCASPLIDKKLLRLCRRFPQLPDWPGNDQNISTPLKTGGGAAKHDYPSTAKRSFAARRAAEPRMRFNNY